MNSSTMFQAVSHMSYRSLLIWRAVQIAVWLVGVFILFNLFFFPDLGLHMFWNILIPVAPALLVLAVGLWRNICPMGSNSLLPRHMGFSKKKKLTVAQSGKLNLVAVIALFIIVPLRHAIFDTNGLATAILILSLATVAISMGVLYEWKSGWCSGLCPVHPVEKLYGLNNKISPPNAHCTSCFRCVAPCPDSTPGIHPKSATKTRYHKIAGNLMVGAFPGFVWGWFQVPNYHGITNFEQILLIYKMPLMGLLVTSLLFLALKRFFNEKTVITLFAAAAVSCYYWFRIPALVGYGIFPTDGMLIDLSGLIPKWFITITIIASTLFFFWWIVLREQKSIKWAIRPVYAHKKLKKIRIKP